MTAASRVRFTKEELAAAAGTEIPDLVAPGVRLLFCGINPGLWTAASGHHFGRPGNRFWKVLHLAGFTPRQLDPSEQELLLGWGIGITNLASRATAAADELTTAELRAGAEKLGTLVEQYRPSVVAFLGMVAYRQAFRRPKAALGRQPDNLGPALQWVLPNPSGLQARYQLPELVELFAQVRDALDAN